MAPEPNSGDTAWTLASAMLVFLMTPALALFYGGFTHQKAIINTMALSYAAMVVVGCVWALIGYSLAFAPVDGPGNPWMGGSAFGAFYTPDDLHPGTNIPESAYMAFQLAFCTITAAVVSGGAVLRIHLWAWAVFIAGWTLLVYVPLARWIFYPQGWLAAWGVLDFAGGAVVEVNAGLSAWVLSYWLGPGVSPPSEPNGGLVLTGAGILWVGWFGFNAGSALSAGYTASRVFLNTQLAACTGMGAWAMTEILFSGPRLGHGVPTAVGAASGVIAGLVAITPACGYVNQMASMVIGGLAAPLSWAIVHFLQKTTNVDDRLDCLGLHGAAGAFGMLATGLAASPNADSPAAGLFYGNPMLFVKQVVAILVTVAVVLVGVSASIGFVFLVGRVSGAPVRLDPALSPLGEGGDESLLDVDAMMHGVRGGAGHSATGLTRREGGGVELRARKEGENELLIPLHSA